MLYMETIRSSMMYSMIEATRLLYTTPFREMVKASHDWNLIPTPPFYTRRMGATYELLERLTRKYQKPTFGITSCNIKGQEIPINEEIAVEKDFCNLIHFKKAIDIKQPILLIFAPMSGHYSTLCRGTVECFLEHFDVYITDWKNARDIPYSKGNFGADDFIDYSIDFIKSVPENPHILAVCQPAVPVSAAVAILSEENSQYLPKTMTLIGGPIDARINPTKVNLYAQKRPINWFKDNVITRVPINYAGFMRPVYPGFIQLAGFMSMNIKRHIDEYKKLFQNLVEGNTEGVDKHKKFYDEYLAVMDLPADFYIETIEAVFKDFTLPRGIMKSRNRPVKLESISKVGLFVIEGENDDITGHGQTKAAIALCSNIPNTRKKYVFEKNVGHYGLFSGSNFRSSIVPKIVDFAYKLDK